MKKLFFLRDDDAAACGPGFIRIFKLLLAKELPAVYAVIPGKTTPALRRFLTRHPAAGTFFETAQHGLRHKDHSGNRFMRQEFGPARSLQIQYSDIAAGRDLMKKNFGPIFAPVFVPPFHMYNSDTVKAAEKAGLKAFSASKSAGGLGGSGLVFLPARVNVNEYDLNLKAKPLDLAALKRKTLAALKCQGPAVGAYFHHADLGGRNFSVFSSYLDFIKDLSRRALITPTLFSAIIT